MRNQGSKAPPTTSTRIQSGVAGENPLLHRKKKRITVGPENKLIRRPTQCRETIGTRSRLRSRGNY